MINETPSVRLPFYLKAAQITLGILAFFYILYIGQHIIVPLVFSAVIAILLNPVVNFLHRKGVNRIIAILLAIVATILLTAALLTFLIAQSAKFAETFPLVKDKFLLLLEECINWLSQRFNIEAEKIYNWLDKMRGEGMNQSSAMIGQTVTTLTGIIVNMLLIPIYIFMMLFYKSLLLDFIAQLFSRDKHGAVIEVLDETKKLIQSYLVGLLLEAGIVAIMSAAGLLILGVDYAILLGVLNALMNFIPYIGGVIGVALPAIVALTTQTPLTALLVVAVLIFIQFVDNNYIVPKIVASKVKINALVSIVVVLIGGALWGVSGMFLSIPLTAIVKVIFDRIDSLKAWGFLLGDNLPPPGKNIFSFITSRRKK